MGLHGPFSLSALSHVQNRLFPIPGRSQLSEVEQSTRLLRDLFGESYARDLIPRCDGEVVRTRVGIALRGLLDVVSRRVSPAAFG